jgi:hypothetical protein
MTQTIARIATRHKARLVGLYYLLTIFTGSFVLFFHGRLAFLADLVAVACFLALTVVLYDLSKPVP